MKKLIGFVTVDKDLSWEEQEDAMVKTAMELLKEAGVLDETDDGEEENK